MRIWFSTHSAPKKNLVNDVKHIFTVTSSPIPILKLVIYSGCNSLIIKLVSEATKLMPQSFFLCFMFCSSDELIIIDQSDLIPNHTANFCYDQILSHIWRTRSLPMVQHLILIPLYVLYNHNKLVAFILYTNVFNLVNLPTKMWPIDCSLIYKWMIKKLVDKLPQFSASKAFNPNLTPISGLGPTWWCYNIISAKNIGLQQHKFSKPQNIYCKPP